ncbi:MAG: hypothetical protein ACK4WC_17330, partial [Rubrimonas sp.]
MMKAMAAGWWARAARLAALAGLMALGAPEARAADLTATAIDVVTPRSGETAVLVRFSRIGTPPAPEVFAL